MGNEVFLEVSQPPIPCGQAPVLPYFGGSFLFMLHPLMQNNQ